MTIYALSTGPGTSGIAIIRISGPQTSSVVESLTGKKMPKPRMATLRELNNINTSELIDEGIIIWFPGPKSYTGEDMAEIHVHGGQAVVLALQKEIGKIKNCRLAEPGEFTKLAFQNGKINLLKAESIADLISAETEIQRLQAVKIMKGKSSKKYVTIYERDNRNRQQAIAIHGLSCFGCGFNFEKYYGEYAKGYIQIHHVKPVSELGGTVKINPETDLIPLCANCHAIVHRKRKQTLSLEDLKELIK